MSEHIGQKWQRPFPPAGKPVVHVRIRMIRTVAASVCMSALLVTGCAHAPQTSHPFVPNSDGTATYTVQANDTYLGIGSRFAVPDYALRGANMSLRGSGAELTAEPGEKLIIPSAL